MNDAAHDNLTLAVEQAGVNVVSLVLVPIASAQAVLSEEEMESRIDRLVSRLDRDGDGTIGPADRSRR